MKTVPELFIIESLDLSDERKGLHEGEILSKMRNLTGKTRTKYFYIRTRRELDEIVRLFCESRYRYLHISCHASSASMSTTFDDITFAQLGTILTPCVEKRRVFVSACEMANERLAKRLLSGTGCYSLIGPAKAIRFDDAAAFWVSFYHLMFKVNERNMKQVDLKRRVAELSALFGEPINYFAKSKSAKLGFRRVNVDL